MRNPVHIAYVCADRGVPVGGHKGASLHVAELVRALVERGARVSVLAARVAEPDLSTLCGAPVTDLGGGRGARRAREALLRAGGELDPATATVEAAAVLLNQELARALEKLHRTEPFHAVYERYSLWSFAAAGFARAHGLPYLLEVNAPLREEQKRYRDLENQALAASLERYLLATADRVLVPSAALLPHVTSHGAAARAVQVIPNAADPSRFRPARRTAPRRATGVRDEFVVGFVGSLKPWHGLADLARAFRRLHRHWKGYRLLVVGEGPLRAEIESRLKSWGLGDAVTFTGATGHVEVPQWLAKMDVAVAPYPADAPTYFSPIKIFEYMASGTPVVASRVGQIAEFLSHRRTALLHRAGSISEMVACIEEIRRRPALAASLSRNARASVVRSYTWKRNAERVLGLVRTAQREHQAASKIGTRSGPARAAITPPPARRKTTARRRKQRAVKR